MVIAFRVKHFRGRGGTVLHNNIVSGRICPPLGFGELFFGFSQSGFDAIGTGTREGKKIQIKGRAIFDDSKGGHRIGQMKTEQDWDSVMLVIMDDNLEPVEIYEAERTDILQALEEHNNKRSKRGAMSVAKFKNIGQLVWSREGGE